MPGGTLRHLSHASQRIQSETSSAAGGASSPRAAAVSHRATAVAARQRPWKDWAPLRRFFFDAAPERSARASLELSSDSHFS